MRRIGIVFALSFLAGCEGELVAHSEGASISEEGTPADVEPATVVAAVAELEREAIPGRGSVTTTLVQGDVAVTGEAYEIAQAHVEGNTLTVEILYGGGCKPHRFGIAWDNLFRGTSANRSARLGIKHERLGDHCRAIVAEEVSFDLTPLADAYRSAYQRTSGTVNVMLTGLETPVAYTF